MSVPFAEWGRGPVSPAPSAVATGKSDRLVRYLKVVVLVLFVSSDSATRPVASAGAASVCVPAFGLPVQATLVEPPAANAAAESEYTCTPSTFNCVTLAP